MIDIDYNKRVITTVACPLCEAEKGEPCRGAFRVVKYTHALRRKAAHQEAAREVMEVEAKDGKVFMKFVKEKGDRGGKEA